MAVVVGSPAAAAAAASTRTRPSPTKRETNKQPTTAEFVVERLWPAASYVYAIELVATPLIVGRFNVQLNATSITLTPALALPSEYTSPALKNLSYYYESAADGLEWRGALPPQVGPPGDSTLYVPLVLHNARTGKAVTTQRYTLSVDAGKPGAPLLLSVGGDYSPMISMRLNINTPGACLLGVTAAAKPCPGVCCVVLCAGGDPSAAAAVVLANTYHP